MKKLVFLLTVWMFFDFYNFVSSSMILDINASCKAIYSGDYRDYAGYPDVINTRAFPLSNYKIVLFRDGCDYLHDKLASHGGVWSGAQ